MAETYSNWLKVSAVLLPAYTYFAVDSYVNHNYVTAAFIAANAAIHAGIFLNESLEKRLSKDSEAE